MKNILNKKKTLWSHWGQWFGPSYFYSATNVNTIRWVTFCRNFGIFDLHRGPYLKKEIEIIILELSPYNLFSFRQRKYRNTLGMLATCLQYGMQLIHARKKEKKRLLSVTYITGFNVLYRLILWCPIFIDQVVILFNNIFFLDMDGKVCCNEFFNLLFCRVEDVRNIIKENLFYKRYIFRMSLKGIYIAYVLVYEVTFRVKTVIYTPQFDF